MKRRGFCAYCGGVYRVKPNGTPTKHKYFSDGTYQPWQPCPGSTQPVKEMNER